MKSIRKKKIVIVSLLVILGILLAILLYNKLDLKHKIFPIYKIEDRVKDVEKAKKKYRDEHVVGWIRVQGTNIDYPIIISSSSMIRTFAGKEEYAWTNVENNDITNYIMVLGHNIRNISTKPIIGDSKMNQFEQLMGYIYYDFNKNNKYIQYTVGGKNYLYQIFAVSLVDDADMYYDVDSYTKKGLKKYIKRVKKESFFDYKVNVSQTDKIISLVTCTRFYGTTAKEFKIDAKLIDTNYGYNYKVVKTDNYVEIEKMLEGVDDDEKDYA